MKSHVTWSQPVRTPENGYSRTLDFCSGHVPFSEGLEGGSAGDRERGRKGFSSYPVTTSGAGHAPRSILSVGEVAGMCSRTPRGPAW